MRHTFFAVLLTVFAIAAGPSRVGAEEFGDWVVDCNPIEVDGKTSEKCFMRQHISLKDKNILLAQYAIGYFNPTSEHPILNITLPLGVLLQPGAALQLGEKKPVAFQYHHCDTNGCWGQFLLGPQAIVDLLAAQKAAIIFVDSAGKPASLPLQLTGFADALKAIR